MRRSPLAAPPIAIALRRSSSGGRDPTPPFGIAAWSNEPCAAVAIALDLAESWAGDMTAVTAQLPHASTLVEGTLVVVLGEAVSRGGRIARLFRKGATVPRAARGSALLARGYRDLGAGQDAQAADLVWGYA